MYHALHLCEIKAVHQGNVAYILRTENQQMIHTYTTLNP